MSDESDFPRLQLKPGTYPFTVVHPDGRRFAGHLELAAGHSPRGEIFGWPYEREGENLNVVSFPQPANIYPALLCELQMGYEALLVDASVEIIFPGRAHFRADAAVIGSGLSSDPESTFPETSLQVTNGHRLFGAVPVVATEGPEELPETGEIELLARVSVDANKTYQHGDVELRARYWYSITRLDYYQFRVRTAPVFELRDVQPLTTRAWIAKHVLPLRELVTLATLESQSVAWLKVDREPEKRGIRHLQVYSRDITQAPYAPRRHMETDARSLFLFSELPYSAVELLERWETLRQTHRSFIEPLMQGIVERMDSRARFLFLVQALEGLHTQTFGAGPTTLEAHRQEREAILREVKALGLPKERRAFLRRWLDNNGRYSLRERLEALRDAVSDEVAALADLDLVPGDVPDYRNKLSHGAATYTPETLQPVSRALAVIGIAHVLRILDLPRDRMSYVFT